MPRTETPSRSDSLSQSIFPSSGRPDTPAADAAERPAAVASTAVREEERSRLRKSICLLYGSAAAPPLRQRRKKSVQPDRSRPVDQSVPRANESRATASSTDLPAPCPSTSDTPRPRSHVPFDATRTSSPGFRTERPQPAIAPGAAIARPGSPRARPPRFPPTASTRRQKRKPPPTANARPAQERCTRRSTQPPRPRCIPRKRKNSPAIQPPALPSATVARSEIHFAPNAVVPRNRKRPPPSRSARPQPSGRPVRSNLESATDKEDRKPRPPAHRILVRQSADTRAYRNAAKPQATHNANRRAWASSP